MEDCCGSGCDPCIFDLYEQARERYALALQQWQQQQQQRHARQPAAKRARSKP